MYVKNLRIGSILTISALLSACSVADTQSTQTLGVNQQGNAGGLGTYLVIDCNEPGSVLVDKSGKEVKTPVRLTVKSDKQSLSSISFKAEIPAHVSLEDPARASVGARQLEFSDAHVMSGNYFETRGSRGFKYEIAGNQKITVIKNGHKKVSNIRSIEISEAIGAEYLGVVMELEGASSQSTEAVVLSMCDLKNSSLLSKFPK